MPRKKLLGEFFWTDRWVGSSAFLLPIEARGLYREMLTQAWMRGGSLPADPAQIMRAVGCSQEEWDRCWPLVKKYWRKNGSTISNDTQREIMEGSKTLSKRRANAGAKGGAKAQANRRANAKSPSLSKNRDGGERAQTRGSPGLGGRVGALPERRPEERDSRTMQIIAERLRDAVGLDPEQVERVLQSGEPVGKIQHASMAAEARRDEDAIAWLRKVAEVAQ